MNKSDRISKLIETLRGSTSSVEVEAEELGLNDLDDEVTDAVDDAIFCCSQCNWWCDISEEASEEVGLFDLTCSECAEE